MSAELAVIYFICIVAIFLFRVVPMFALKGRELSPDTKAAFGLIAPAAFAALVANDLLNPERFAEGAWSFALPLVAGAIVAIVANRTKSLIWSAVVGLVCYALLSLI